jgi:hypothetical protein
MGGGNERLGRQVVDLGGLDRVQQAHQRHLVEQVRLVQRDPVAQVGDALEVLGARAPHHAVHRVALVEQQLRQV